MSESTAAASAATGGNVGSRRRAPLRRALSGTAIGAAAAVVLALLPATTASASSPSESSGGAGAGAGTVDERTGLLQIEEISLGTIVGEGASTVPLKWKYRQPSQDARVDAGLGIGMSWGNPEIVDGRDLVMESGQSFRLDPSTKTGVADHPEENLKVTVFDEPLEPGSEECPATRVCAYAVDLLDGTRHVLDVNGKLSATSDRDKSTVRWDYDEAGRVDTITGGRAEAPITATVVYNSDESIEIHLPERADGQKPVVTAELSGGLLERLVDPAGDEQFRMTWTDQYAGVPLPSGWTIGTGARATVKYQSANGTIAVEELRTLDDDGAEIAKPVLVDIDPVGDTHNHRGFPTHHQTIVPPKAQTTDPLVYSNDKRYTYKVAISDGVQTTTREYNHLHQLISEEVRAHVEGFEQVLSRTEYTYPGGADAMWPKVPGAFRQPETVTRMVYDLTGREEPRTVTSRYEYDAMSRALVEERGGIRTEYVYDSDRLHDGDGFGIMVESTRTALTGPDAGTARTESATLVEGRTAVQRLEKSATTPDGTRTVSEVIDRTYTASGAVASETITGYAADGSATTRTTTTDRQLDGGRLVTSVTDPGGLVTRTLTDLASGKVVEDTAAGITTITGYDILDRAVRIEQDGRPATTVSYETFATDGINRTTTVRESDGFATRETTDALGRGIHSEDNQVGGKVAGDAWRSLSRAVYDARGNQVEAIDGAGRSVHTEWDHADRIISRTNPDGTGVRVTYDDARGLATTALHAADSDDASVTTTVTRDDEGRVIKQVTSYADGTPTITRTQSYTGFGEADVRGEENANRQVQNGYDAHGRLTGTRIQAPGTTVDSIPTHDGSGNRTGKKLVIDGDQGGAADAHTDVFTDDGRLISSTDAAGDVTGIEYDDLNRAVRTTYADGRIEHTEYTALSQIDRTWWTQPGSDERLLESVYEYGDTHTTAVAVHEPSDPEGTRIRYAYTPDSTMRSITYPDGSTVQFSHNDAGEMEALTDPHGVKTSYERDAATGRLLQTRTDAASLRYEYDRFGRIAKTERFDAAGTLVGATAQKFNDAGLLTERTHTDATGALVERNRHSYTALGMLERTRTELGETVPAEDGDLAGQREHTTVHEYDGIDRLAGTTIYAGQTASTEEDAVATRLRDTRYLLNARADTTTVTVTERDGATSVTDYTIDVVGKKTAVTIDGVTSPLEWDAAGNLVLDENGTRHSYDAAGNPTSSVTADGQAMEITYRADGSRHETTTSTAQSVQSVQSVESFTLPAGTIAVIAERVTENGVTSDVSTLVDTTATAVVTDGSPTWLLTNARGDVTSTLDGAGVTQTRTSYTDYGAASTWGTPGAYQPYGYTGARTDKVTGLLHLGIRQLDTAIGQFTTKDPTSLLARYSYAAGNPIHHTDPTGTTAQPWQKVLAGLTDFVGHGFGLVFAGIALGAAITAVTGGGGAAASTALIAASIGMALEAGATAMTAVLYVDNLRSGEWLSTDAKIGLWAGSMGASILGGFASGFARSGVKAATAAPQLRKQATDLERRAGLAAEDAEHYMTAAARERQQGRHGFADIAEERAAPFQKNKAELLAQQRDIEKLVTAAEFPVYKLNVRVFTAVGVTNAVMTGYLHNPWTQPVMQWLIGPQEKTPTPGAQSLSSTSDDIASAGSRTGTGPGGSSKSESAGNLDGGVVHDLLTR